MLCNGRVAGWIGFYHVNDRQCDSVLQWQLDPLLRDITSLAKELFPGKCCAHFEASEAGRPGGVLTIIQNDAADAAARPVRMNEECPHLGGICFRVQQVVLPLSPAITAIERLAFAPAAAARNHWFPSGLRR